MIYSKYYSIVLEAVTQGSKVCGCPSRILFRSAKTTLFLLLILVNISIADEIEDECLAFIKKFNEISPIKLALKEFESGRDAEARVFKQREEAEAVALNKAEVREHRYWIDGRWVCTDKDQSQVKVYRPAQTELEIIDSDNDGYDDYTEHKHGTNPQDATRTPAIRKGNNLVTFKMDGCEAGFQFEMFKGSYTGAGIGVISVSKETLKKAMYR